MCFNFPNISFFYILNIVPEVQIAAFQSFLLVNFRTEGKQTVPF